MNKNYRNTAVLALLLLAGALGWAQETKADRAVVPLSDPTKPAVVKASIMRGSITVKAYAGKEIIVEAVVRERSLDRDHERGARGVITPAPPAPPAPPAAVVWDEDDDDERADRRKDRAAGMKRLSVASTGLEVEEDNNVVEISTQSWRHATDLTIQVPASTSLEIGSTNDGEIFVEGLSGELEINNVNGPVTLRNVSGTAVAHTVNGDLEVALTRTTPGKPMSFSTMNGDVDVTLPADIKADLKMKSQMGEVFSDFDIVLKQVAQKSEEEGKADKGKYRISFDKSVYGTINGGGPEISFQTFNGDIYIRKRK